MNIFVDVDGTVADLLSEWLNLYNGDYDDTLTPEQITAWDMTKFVKPDCGVHIYDYLIRDDLYDSVQPIQGATEGVWALRNLLEHRIVYASSGIWCVAKFKWLERWGFEPGQFGKDFISVNDKSLLRGDLLIDDRDKNVIDFQGNLGKTKAILFDAPYNQELNWYPRAKSWVDVFNFVKELS